MGISISSISKVPIFVSDKLDHLKEVDSRAWMQSRDGAVCRPVLEPTRTAVRPRRDPGCLGKHGCGEGLDKEDKKLTGVASFDGLRNPG
jgi:hypothetical protein